MASSDFAQKLLHDLRLRKERMANAKNSGMYSNSSQNIKGSRETRTLEVGPKAGNRYRNSSSQKTPSTPKNANQIVPYNGGYHSRQNPELSMALAYAFDNKGKLKRLDIASSGPMMNLLQQIGRKSTQQQRFDIQWQSTNQFPTLTNLHINEISKGAQKLNQLLRGCSNGGIDINRGTIEIGKELWKGAMELEQALRMLVSLQEASSDNMMAPQRRSRIRLLDDNGESEDDITESLNKQKKVECPVFSFDKPSKNTKMSVQKLKFHTQIEDRNPNPERYMSVTSTSTHRRNASSGSESNTSQLTNSTTLKQNEPRLPSVIAKLMGIEELPHSSNLKVATENLASEHRSRDSVSTHTTPKRSKNAEVMIEYIRPAKKPVDQFRVEELTKNHYTALARERPDWRLEERQGIKIYAQESKTAISKTNEMQTKSMNLNQGNKMQNDIRLETFVNGRIQKPIEVSKRFPVPRDRSLNTEKTTHEYTQSRSNRQKIREADTRTIQLPQQKQYRNVKLEQTDMSYQPHGKNLKVHKSQEKENRIIEHGRKEKGGGKMQSSRIIVGDVKMEKQLLARIKSPKDMENQEDIILVGSKALQNNEQNEYSVRENSSKNSNDGMKDSMSLKLESAMEARSEMKEMNGVPSKSRGTEKANKETVIKVRAPREISRTLKPHETASGTLNQNKRDKISVLRGKLADKSISKSTESKPKKDKPNHSSVCEESQRNEDTDQMDSSNHTLQNALSQQLKEVIEITSKDKGEKNISIIHDGSQERLTEEVVVKAPVTTVDQDDCKVNPYHQQKSIKEETEPLTEDELFLKQNLILSQLFLNTAEALFKLNIPISVLNYASDQISETKDCKIILDCGYELLKRKGRRKIAIIYPSINISVSYTQIKSLDDLVRQLNKDFEALRFYGSNEKETYDYANSIQKMMESDIYNKHPDLNSMWDVGWYDMFSCASMDEVICNVEQLMLDELVNELVNNCL